MDPQFGMMSAPSHYCLDEDEQQQQQQQQQQLQLRGAAIGDARRRSTSSGAAPPSASLAVGGSSSSDDDDGAGDGGGNEEGRGDAASTAAWLWGVYSDMVRRRSACCVGGDARCGDRDAAPSLSPANSTLHTSFPPPQTTEDDVARVAVCLLSRRRRRPDGVCMHACPCARACAHPGLYWTACCPVCTRRAPHTSHLHAHASTSIMPTPKQTARDPKLGRAHDQGGVPRPRARVVRARAARGGRRWCRWRRRRQQRRRRRRPPGLRAGGGVPLLHVRKVCVSCGLFMHVCMTLHRHVPACKGSRSCMARTA